MSHLASVHRSYPMRADFVALGLFLLVCFMGCGPRLPMYPIIDSRTTLTTMAERNTVVQSISARCRLILERPGDGSVELTAALVSIPPHRHRLRAWKLTEPVMDMTITEDETWMWAKDELINTEGKTIFESLSSQGGTIDYLREGLNVAFGVLESAQWSEVSHASNELQLVIDRSVGGGVTMRCVIDRPSLTVVEVHIVDAETETRFILRLDRHRRFGPALLPARLRGTAEDHRFTLILQNVDINGEIPAGAFRPPPGASRR